MTIIITNKLISITFYVPYMVDIWLMALLVLNWLVPAFLFVILLERLPNYKLSTFTRQDDVTQYRDFC